MRVLFLLFLLAGMGLAEPLQLDFEKVTVRLYPELLEWEREGEKTYFDFARRRTWKKGADNSLYAVLGGRDAEFGSRLQLRQVLEQTHVDEPGMAVAQLEHLFSLRAPESPTQLAFEDQAGALTVKAGDRVLLEASADGFPVDADTARLYVRFLRYYVGIHPAILEKLQAAGKVPNRLTVMQLNVDQKRVVQLNLQGHSVPGPALMPTTNVVEGPLGKLMERAGTSPVPVDFGLAGARQALAAKQYLQAFLALFDNGLTVGGNLAPDLAANQARFDKDPNTAKLIKALKSKDVKVLQALEKPAGRYAYMLKVFRGGLLMGDDDKTATTLYTQALQAQPKLTGAWKDLGELYYRNFDADTAWQCWDVADRLAPEHQLMRPVKALEKGLREDHPEYF